MVVKIRAWFVTVLHWHKSWHGCLCLLPLLLSAPIRLAWHCHQGCQFLKLGQLTACLNPLMLPLHGWFIGVDLP